MGLSTFSYILKTDFCKSTVDMILFQIDYLSFLNLQKYPYNRLLKVIQLSVCLCVYVCLYVCVCVDECGFFFTNLPDFSREVS